MITLYQAGQLSAANGLMEAKRRLLDVRTLAAWSHTDQRRMDFLIDEIGSLFAKLIPNEPSK